MNLIPKKNCLHFKHYHMSSLSMYFFFFPPFVRFSSVGLGLYACLARPLYVYQLKNAFISYTCSHVLFAHMRITIYIFTCTQSICVRYGILSSAFYISYGQINGLQIEEKEMSYLIDNLCFSCTLMSKATVGLKGKETMPHPKGVIFTL